MQCQAKTKRGKRCLSAALHGAEYCFAHDPQSTEVRSLARIKGGHNRRRPVRLSGDTPLTIATMGDVLQLLNCVIRDSWALDNSALRSRVLLTACETAVKVLQQTDIEQRIEKLERMRGYGYEPGAAA